MKFFNGLTIGHLGLAALLAATLAGCGGGGGGGTTTPPPPPPPTTVDLTAELAQARSEQCALCHAGNTTPFMTGPKHMAEYAKYADASKFTLTIDSVTNNGNDSILTFTVTKNGSAAEVDTAAEIAALAQKTFYAVKYDSATRKYTPSFSYSAGTTAANYTVLGNGQFSVKKTTAPFFPENENAHVYAYVADGVLDTEGMTLYDDVANAAKAYGTAMSTDGAAYVSAANVSACETCHGKPYMKHGYRAAQVAGIPDFAACKDCHYDDRNGGHQDWQLLKDDPAQYAALEAAAAACKAAADASCDTLGEQITLTYGNKYVYTANVMNDVHMSHGMEFPYPQTMQSCTTCHSGKMGDTAANDIFADAKFKASTCVSCHSVDGLQDKMTAGGSITIHDTFIAKIADSTQRDTIACTVCHGSTAGIAPTFATIHKNGYDPKIYATSGTRYSTSITASVDSAAYNPTTHMLDLTFSAAGSVGGVSSTTMKPTILIGLYGYNTKDFIVAAHGRDFDDNGDGALTSADKRNLEYVWGDGNPRFVNPVKSDPTHWSVSVDLSNWADKIAADGVIRRAEVAFLPEVKDASGTVLGLDAPSKTFNFASNAFESYFPALVNVAKTVNGTTGSVDGCNSCHDQLATTFHSGIRGGNIRVCRICHEVSNGGAHLELQSRSIDSYVHGIHSFQAFDPGDIDFDDPVASQEFRHHVESSFPRFTIKDCEACHSDSSNVYAAGRHAYDVPDQAKSLPGVLSGTDTIANRDLPAISPAVTGPAVRACGACHRAQALNANDGAGDAPRLATMIAHWQSLGYYIEIAAENTRALWEAVVEKIMAIFG